MRKLLLGGAALALLAGSPAFAADLDMRPAPYFKAPPPALYNWTGFYFGANVGYSWGQHTNDWAVSGFPAGSESQDMDGAIGGVQWGYNWQFGNWVLGSESDFQWSGQSGSTNYCVVSCAVATFTADHKLPWFGTTRTRLGILPTPNILLYATGGLAYGRVKSDYTLTVPAVATGTLSFSDTRAGWTVGAGIEGAVMGGWSAKLEYLYIDLGKNSVSATTTVLGAVATFDSRVTDNILRVGINYKLGGGS
jgi:outer membrane immunogenic protein